MPLRSIFSRRTTADAVRRMKAVIGVIDSDLAELAAQLADPLPTRTLSEAEWQTAEVARAAVERDLRQLEAETVVVGAQVRDWQAKEALPAKRGDTLLATQARMRADEADAVYRSYVQEINVVRVFLHEWAARVTRADSGRPSTPLANER